MTPTLSLHAMGPTSGQELALRKMLRSLLGGIDFDRLCFGMKVGTIDEDVLHIFVPTGNYPTDIMIGTLRILLSPPSTRLVSPFARWMSCQRISPSFSGSDQ
jgi:hypothetical protein